MGHGMWPFRRKPLLDADTASWHLDNFEWLVRNFARRHGFSKMSLVLPAPGFFKNNGEQGHKRAQLLFDQVKAYCGINEHINLVGGDDVPSSYGAPSVDDISYDGFAAGLYYSGGGVKEATISYASYLLEDSQTLITVFAHELAHYVLDCDVASLPPIADGEDEYLTDLTAVFLGFGVFFANNALRRDKVGNAGQEYLQLARAGYLPERDLIFATAIFIAVRELDPGPAIKCLKPHLAAFLNRALSDLEAHADQIATIRSRANGYALQQILR